jgi:predicted glycogen debranching enzyme
MEAFLPVMDPAPGERLVRFVGDHIRFNLRDVRGRTPPAGWNARLRTNLGRAAVLRREIIHARSRGVPLADASWRDIPMCRVEGGWSIELPVAEPGYFQAKAYVTDERGWQHWPGGSNLGVSVHPDFARTANTIYCAFPRLFGATRTAARAMDAAVEKQFQKLDKQDYTVIPPSGKLRDLIPHLTHIVDGLGCRVLHLLPINPAPTVYARMGRFGSPYASGDLRAVDPALVCFDRRTTGVDQFRELSYATHCRGARVFLDIVINHTGWGSPLQEYHPEWFLRDPDGTFTSPGAWGITWGDLIELGHDNSALWDELADVFLCWCRRGVDGFRCDAGYKVPMPAWQYIVARVQEEFPNTLFLLEGLGGAWDLTENLLIEGGMQWAYSELFQNFDGPAVQGYLDHALKQSRRVGLLVHYSETHDNARLAAKGRAWTLLRNRLCALASVSGGFGFTCGVEWLAAEKIDVHFNTGLAWENPDNITPELARLNRLLATHPAFFDGAQFTRLSPPGSPVYALLRKSAEGADAVLVLVNTDPDHVRSAVLPATAFSCAPPVCDLLGQTVPEIQSTDPATVTVRLTAGAAYCLAKTPGPAGLSGDAYRRARSQAAWAVEALSMVAETERVDGLDWRWLAAQVERSPADFLNAALAAAESSAFSQAQLEVLLKQSASGDLFPRVVLWELPDRNRVLPVPPGHWLLIRDTVRFRAALEVCEPPGEVARHVESVTAGAFQYACFPPQTKSATATITLERFMPCVEKRDSFQGCDCGKTIHKCVGDPDRHPVGRILFLDSTPVSAPAETLPKPDDIVLLTNGRGGMARMCADLGRVKSKYDCVLAANLHPGIPVDRHVFVKRMRVWVNADGFLSPLDAQCLSGFVAGPPAVWQFTANAGDGRVVEIQMTAWMPQGRNTTLFRLERLPVPPGHGKSLPADADVRLTVRFDIEDRNFHWETKRNGGAEAHFSSHTGPLVPDGSTHAMGFSFTPAADRQLRVFADAGAYHPQPEWSINLPHTIEATRGQTDTGDAFSPGWFELPLPINAGVTITATAERDDEVPSVRTKAAHPEGATTVADWQLGLPSTPARKPVHSPMHADPLTDRLARACHAFVARRDAGKTVIAGYPWFLDWGRDSLICARGLLSAGLVDDVQDLLLTFARFEDHGTLPNTIHGHDASNRETSDAPLWFGVACEDLAAIAPGRRIHSLHVAGERTLADVLESIATGYLDGTSNGIRMDPASALVWSPTHFTWMDTNHPSGTPRQGYPVEIQALWIRLLSQLAGIRHGREGAQWAALADRARGSLEKYFWLEEQGWFSDVLVAGPGQPAASATPDDALRSNFLFAISLGLLRGGHARRAVEAARRHLIVPGALRSLAPLPVRMPLPIRTADGRALNDPGRPYWGRYEGDEDTRRKPAYHNGTAWTWTFPVFCEALALAWDCSPAALSAARACLAGVQSLLDSGCLGHLPEIVDGDAPHQQRGCDAQAWGATEAMRVWTWLAKQSQPATAPVIQPS